jgi:hypothetical protein
MTIHELFTKIQVQKTLMVAEQEFKIFSLERTHLTTGDVCVWLWSPDGEWLIADQSADEFILFSPTEEELEVGEDGFVAYRGENFEELNVDRGIVDQVEDGEDETPKIEAGDAFEVTQFESEEGNLIRRLERTESGEAQWFYGGRLTEDEVRPV